MSHRLSYSEPKILTRITVRWMAVLVIQGVALTSAFNVCAVERNLPVETFAESLLQINREQEVVTLELGRSVERELAGGQEHSFQITLTEGQFARVISEQRGIDLVVTLFGVDGKSIADFDADITNHGEETTELVADRAGTYRLLVKPRYPKLPIGSYRIEWVEAHDATENDRLSHEARRLLAESKRLSDAGKYTDALMPAERALELRERISGRQHPDLYHPLLNLFVVNFLNGNYAKAEAFCARALTITENALGPEHPLVARLLYNLAVLYSTTGDDSRAELFVQRALSIQAKALGPDHPHIAQSLNRLAVLLRNRGDFVRAELLFQQALAISEKALGDDDEDVAQSLNTLAGLYREKGDYTKAEPLYVRSLNISEKKRGSDHPYLAAPLHNLATLYRDMGEFDKGERLYQRSITIREKATGPNHPNVAGSRASLALLYYMRGDYAKAEPLYLSALAILEKALGSNHPLVAWYLSKLGNLYVALNDDAKAESLFCRALGIYEAAYGTNSYYLADILLELAKMSAVEGKLKEAIAFQARANEITEYHINLNIFTGSERQKLAYLAKWPEQMNQAISLHVRLAADNPMARELAATAVLQRKGRVQDALSLSLASLHSRFSAEEQGLLDQWNAATSRVARLVLNEPQGISPAEHQKQIRILQERREKLESEISSRNTAFYENARPITLAAVQAAIPEKAALVEFAIYRPFDPKAPHKRQSYGESRYIAYVLHHQGPTEWVELGEAKTIDDAVSKLRRALHDPSRKDVQRLARDLDQKLMRPVRALTYDATQLLISPDGDLNLIPFEALVDEQGRYLVERYAFAYLTSGRDLLRLQTARKSKTPPVVFADPAFGDPALIASSNGSSITSAPSRSQFNYSQIFFGPLPGVGDEVRTLKTLLPQATFFTRNEASEANLKHVSAPSILHVATHGFFLENESSAKDRTTVKAADLTRLGKWAVRVENPLLRSGLALAGVNQGGNGDDDGVLTALEASALDLWGTKLVVLSACDTGVGEVKNGEGVYGLRRALFLAGTESQLMSLWPVSDRSTRQLMAGYYQALVQNAGRAEALRQVRLKMLRNKPRSHPYYWASFILAGEWANLKGQR